MTCVDSSETALSYVNATLLRTACRSARSRMDAFDALKQLHEQGERFDVVVIDPPAFIKRKKDIPQGTAAYRKLNQLAMNLIGRDGLLVSCSCSYHLSADDHLDAIQAAARHYGAVRAGTGGRRPVAGPSCAPRGARNPLSEGVLLPDHARMSAGRPRTPLNFAPSNCTRTGPGITTTWLRLPPPRPHDSVPRDQQGRVRARTRKGPLVRHHVPARLRGRMVAGPASRRAAGQHVEAGGRRRPRLLLHARRHPRRPRRLRVLLRPAVLGRQPVVSAAHLGRRHVDPRRPHRRRARARPVREDPQAQASATSSTSPCRCRVSA